MAEAAAKHFIRTYNAQGHGSLVVVKIGLGFLYIVVHNSTAPPSKVL